MHLRSVLVFLLGLCTLPLAAQASSGGNGDLDATPMAINANFTLTVTGGANQGFAVYYSDATAALPTPFGMVWIDPLSPVFAPFFTGTLSPAGTAAFSVFIPNDPNLLNLVLYVQGAVTDPGQTSGIALTRAIRIDFENPDSFLALPALSQARALASGDLLKDGRVLVAGGGNGTLLGPVATPTTEFYEPYTRSWSAGPNLSIERAMHASAALADGRILITGGTSTTGTVTSSCEIFDPVTNTFSAAASMGVARAGHAATALLNGKVLVTGGTSTFAGTAIGAILNASSNGGEVYDPVTNTWAPVSNAMASKRFVHTQTRLADGRVLVVSGISGATTIPFTTTEVPTFTTSCNIYDPATNSFGSAASIPTARAAHRATLMGNGEVFVGGGVFSSLFVPTATNDSRKYSVTGNSWTSAGLLPASIALQGQVLLKNGVLHISGGGTGTLLAFSATAVCETRVAGGATFTATAAMPDARGFHLAVRLADGSILISGGGDSSGAAVATNLLYTPTP
jgi:hypothetical protein